MGGDQKDRGVTAASSSSGHRLWLSMCPLASGLCHGDDIEQMLSLQLEGPAVTQRGGQAQPHTASALPQD